MKKLPPFYVCHVHYINNPKFDVMVHVKTKSDTTLGHIRQLAAGIAYSINRPHATSMSRACLLTYREAYRLSDAIPKFQADYGFRPKVVFHYG